MPSKMNNIDLVGNIDTEENKKKKFRLKILADQLHESWEERTHIHKEYRERLEQCDTIARDSWHEALSILIQLYPYVYTIEVTALPCTGRKHFVQGAYINRRDASKDIKRLMEDYGTKLYKFNSRLIATSKLDRTTLITLARKIIA